MDQGLLHTEQIKTKLVYRSLILLSFLAIVGSNIRNILNPINPNTLVGYNIAGVIFFILSMFAKNNIKENLIRHISCFLIILLAAVLPMSGYFFQAPIYSLLIVVPVFSSFILGSRGAVFYSTLSIMSLAVVYSLHTSGHFDPKVMSMSHFLKAKLLVFSIAIVLALGISLIYEYTRNLYDKILISEKNRADEVTKAKTKFISTVVHEIRNPMNAVVGMTDVLLQELQGEEHTKKLHVIKNSASSLVLLVNDLLEFSQSQSRQFKINAQTFHLRRLMDELSIFYEPEVKAKGLYLKFDMDSSIPDYLFGDPVRLRQILINLMSNALKFTKVGGVSVHVKMEDENENKMILHFEVKDTGIGIKKENLSKLFKEYSQAEETTQINYGGTGLGLHITKNICEKMNAKIWVESKIDEGSSFHVKIPYQRVRIDADEQTKSREGMKDASKINFQAISVLVVDDQKINTDVLSAQLDLLGCRHQSTNHANEVMEILQTFKPDIIFLDYHMPEINGLDLAKHIVETSGGNKPRLILLTGAKEEIVRSDLDLTHVDDIVEKPLKQSFIIEQLSKIES